MNSKDKTPAGAENFPPKARNRTEQHKQADPLFSVRCEPPPSQRATETPQVLSVFISQRLRSHGVEQPWNTVMIHCDEEPDGALTTRVVISNPDWNERVEIARIKSRPSDPNSLTALGCNLNHRRI